MTTAGFSRRQVLTVAGLALGVGIVEMSVPTAAAWAEPSDPPLGKLTLEAVVDEPVAVLSGKATAPTACPRQLAVKVVNEDVELPAGTQLTVSFDPRLFAVIEPAIVTLGGRPVATTSTTTGDPATGLRTCTVTLRQEVPARAAATGDLVVLLGTAHPRLYPFDLVRRPADAVADMASTRRLPGAHRDLRPTRPPAFGGPATPWGIELAGGWGRRTWGAENQYWYYYPVQISMRSTGPGGAPVAAAFTVSVDPQVVRDIAVASVRLNDEPLNGGKVHLAGTVRTTSVYQTQWRSGVMLKPGDALDLELRVSTLAPGGAIDFNSATLNVPANSKRLELSFAGEATR